mmetsp:Transcript_120710/g.276660  ORF Transcript_120710/g.276660 Transcript_120710/m.276660 type:complete len:231 (+) Transcript_120710:1841-2533(+)
MTLTSTTWYRRCKDSNARPSAPTSPGSSPACQITRRYSQLPRNEEQQQRPKGASPGSDRHAHQRFASARQSFHNCLLQIELNVGNPLGLLRCLVTNDLDVPDLPSLLREEFVDFSFGRLVVQACHDNSIVFAACLVHSLFLFLFVLLLLAFLLLTLFLKLSPSLLLLCRATAGALLAVSVSPSIPITRLPLLATVIALQKLFHGIEINFLTSVPHGDGAYRLYSRQPGDS